MFAKIGIKEYFTKSVFAYNSELEITSKRVDDK